MQSSHELEQCERANQTGRQPVVFVHGLWLLPSSWDRWAKLFEDNLKLIDRVRLGLYVGKQPIPGAVLAEATNGTLRAWLGVEAVHVAKAANGPLTCSSTNTTGRWRRLIQLVIRRQIKDQGNRRGNVGPADKADHIDWDRPVAAT